MKSAFVDTNILVYAANSAASDSRKKRIAREIILLPRLHLSVQVLNEFIAVSRHPNKLNFSRAQEAKWLREWFELKINPLSFTTFQKALELHLAFQISHWDSLIIASARESACAIVYSEDLNHGQDYDGVTVMNPFL